MYGYGYQAVRQRKVAIYARVSTEHEAQLSALENQKDWYNPIIAQHPEWEIVRMYTDEGITGTSAKKRPQFMKMIEDPPTSLCIDGNRKNTAKVSSLCKSQDRLQSRI